jgi:hypothetical protein
VSHKDKKTVDDFIEWVVKTYRTIGQVKVTRGNVHKYLGMKLNYEVEGQVPCNMTSYVQVMIKDFLQQLDGESKIPWNDKLFKVNEDTSNLDKNKAEQFHTVVAKGLFVQVIKTRYITCNCNYSSQVSRPRGLGTASKIDEVLEIYKLLCAYPESSGDRKLKWYADAVFAVHPDYKSPTGATMTMGAGAVISISRKQRLSCRVQLKPN